jgi:low affinity Fe/Cu permease
MTPTKSTTWFGRFAKRTARAAGRPYTFFGAITIVAVWAAMGPMFGYSDTWQLVINTGTTIITFLMVFLIQSTQNRDSEALHLKLDELICALEGAHNAVLDLEELEEKDLDRIRENYAKIAKSARDGIRKGNVGAGRMESKGLKAR